MWSSPASANREVGLNEWAELFPVHCIAISNIFIFIFIHSIIQNKEGTLFSISYSAVHSTIQ